ncbi:MAG: putative Ribokinase [Parcubacteria group bacterium Gr01-1014_46]|nr:MAG: putative Ribokinase [Parcubacteria group bacterium Gr01-1014_46]
MSFFKKTYDFVAIGDITTDAFIKLKEANVNCDINEEHCTISMKFGDKIPYQSVDIVSAVGNAPNAAVSASRLGINSALVTNIGSDQNGKDCLRVLEKERVSHKYISVHKGFATNYHYVLWYEKDRTILVKHHEYEYNLPDIGSPKWLYLSSLGPSTREYHKKIAGFLKKHPNTKLAFQPGTFQMSLGTDELKDIYSRTEIFFCNDEEAERILGKPTGTNIKELLLGINNLGPKSVVITMGPKGAYGLDTRPTKQGQSFGRETGIYFAPAFNPEEPAFERTGAGDAFASACTSALLLGKTLPTAMSWGAVNGMSVCRYVGAQKGLLTQGEIEYELSKKPDYKVSAI